MAKYRMRIDAWVCLTVEATSKKEAVAKATKALDEISEGLSIDLPDENDGMVYVNDNLDSVPEVVNVE